MEFKRGKVHELIDGGEKARCVPSDNSQIVTMPLVVPYYWRSEMGNIQVGEDVYYLEDDAMGGIILSRLDGNWDFVLRGNLTVIEDVTASGKSLKSHTHTGVHGETSHPN